MKSFRGYLKAIIIILIIMPLLANSCSDKENAGYYSIPIPGYETEQYYNMLQSQNEKIQYNAICNLWATADIELLEKDSLKSTPAYALAKNIYDKIFLLMDAKNSWVSSAAIRYAGRYSYNRKAFFQHILSKNDPSVNLQLAIWAAWKNRQDTDMTDSDLLVKKTHFCLQHTDWLIQQCAYDYITVSSAPYFENEFIKSYYSTKEQHKKLQILNALNKHLCDTVFNFLTREYAASTDTLLQQFILLSLPKSINRQQSLAWYKQNKKETMLALKYGNSFDEQTNFYPSLALIALQQGWDPAKIQLYSKDEEAGPLLYYYVFENKYRYDHSDSANPGQTDVYKKIEQQLLNDNRLKSSWLDYERTHIRFSLPVQLINEHRLLTSKYSGEVRLLFNKYSIDSSAYEDFLVPLENNANGLYKKKFPHKIKD